MAGPTARQVEACKGLETKLAEQWIAMGAPQKKNSDDDSPIDTTKWGLGVTFEVYKNRGCTGVPAIRQLWAPLSATMEQLTRRLFTLWLSRALGGDSECDHLWEYSPGGTSDDCRQTTIKSALQPSPGSVIRFLYDFGTPTVAYLLVLGMGPAPAGTAWDDDDEGADCVVSCVRRVLQCR